MTVFSFFPLYESVKSTRKAFWKASKMIKKFGVASNAVGRLFFFLLFVVEF